MGYQLLFFVSGLTKRFKIIFKTEAIHKKMATILNTVFAKKRKFTFSIGKPGNTAVKFKVSHQST